VDWECEPLTKKQYLEKYVELRQDGSYWFKVNN
jgi:hypothetical protein